MTFKDLLYLIVAAAVAIAAYSLAEALAIGTLAIGTGSVASLVVRAIAQMGAFLLFGMAEGFLLVWGTWLAAGKPER